MASDKWRNDVTRSLGAQGYLYYADPVDFVLSQQRAQGQQVNAEAGRADLLVVRNGRGWACEIKNGTGNTFAFKQWTDDQRRWAEKCEMEYGTPYYLFFLLGDNPPNYDPDKYSPRRAWLVRRTAFLAAESQVLPVQGTLVYRAAKGHRLQIQEQLLDAVTLLADYELTWNKGIWELPEVDIYSAR